MTNLTTWPLSSKNSPVRFVFECLQSWRSFEWDLKTTSSVCVCSCGQRPEENDHHWRHLVIPFTGSGGSERCRVSVLTCCWPCAGVCAHLNLLSSLCALQVLSCHIPFLVSSVEDFKDHIPRETDMKVEHTLAQARSLTGEALVFI